MTKRAVQKGKIIVVICAAIFWMSVLLIQSCSTGEESPDTAPVSMLGNTSEFLGSESCKSCHEDEYAKWSESHHAKAMMEPSDSTILGDFNNAVFTGDGVTSRFFKKGDKFIINTEGPGGEYQDMEVKYTFGVYPLQQYLIEQEGGRLQTTRVTWDSEKNQWFNQHAGEVIHHSDWLHWTRSSMTWNTMCSHCHSTNLKKNFDLTKNEFNTTWDLINVGCEGCHGPGKRHVELSERGVELNEQHQLYMKTGEFNVVQIESCAPCHSRRSMIKEPHNFKEQFTDQYIVSSLSDNLYFPDGQILDEDYVYGSFVQSKMYGEGVKCSDCHDVHRAALKLEGNALCLQCHEQPKYDTKEHHFHDLKTDGAQCINCHMPGRTYMGNDFRRDHSFRIPRPDLTVRFDTPNSCNGCHEDESAQWAADQVESWHGKPEQTYYDILALASQRNPDDGEIVSELILDITKSYLIRSTALEYLVESGFEGTLEVVVTALSDPAPHVRMTAVNQLYNIPAEQRLQLVLPLVSDKSRIVRMAAASALSDIDPSTIDPGKRQDLLKATDEYRSSLFLNGDFPSGQMLIGQFFRRTGNNQRAEEAFVRSLELDSLYIPTRVNLAQLYNAEAQNEKALDLLQSIINIEPGYADAYYMKGLILAEKGNLEEAALSLKKNIELNPYNIRAFYNLGLIYQNMGNTSDAERVYKNGLESAPEDDSIHNALAILYIQNQRLAEARPHVEFLYKKYPNNPQIQQMAQMVK